MKSVQRLLGSTSLLISAAMFACPAFSQQAAVEGPPQQADSEPAPSADIIVTAQRREQSLQDVPVVVSVVNESQLRNAGVRDIKDLQNLVPGLNVTQTSSSSQTSVRIRGIGTIGDNIGLESSVGTVIDNVYRVRSSTAFGDLGPVSRIEVLKGPQSTLFGKNTSAGVINVVTREPSFKTSTEFEGSYGNYDAYALSASVTGGLVDDVVAGSLFAVRRERDGFMDVGIGAGPRTDREDLNQDYYSLRGQLLVVPASGAKIRIIADYTNRKEICCANTPSRTGPTAAYIDALASDAGTVAPANPFDRLTYANRPNNSNVEDYGISADATFDLTRSLSLNSVTSYREWSGEGGFDADFTSADIWYRPASTNRSDFKVFTQELRLSFSSSSFNGVLGGFYADERLKNRAELVLGPDYEPYFGLLLSGGADRNRVSGLTGLPVGTGLPAGSTQDDTHRQSVRTAALYADGTVTLAQGLELNLGLRYTDERKRLRSHYTTPTPPAGCIVALARALPSVSSLCTIYSDPAFTNLTTAQALDTGRLSGTAKLSYRLSPQVMTYASYANGWKSGGFNLDRARFGNGIANPDTGFPIEKVESYEIGAKTTLMNRRLLVNIAGFKQDYTNFQLLTFTGVGYLVLGIPSVVSKGVDFDVLFDLHEYGINLTGGATYADTRYGSFAPPPGISPRLPGNRLSFAAKWNVTAGISSRQALSSKVDLTSSASVKWTSSYNTGSDLDPLKLQKPYAIVDARIGLASSNKVWTVEAFAQNLTNADYYQAIINQPLQSGTLGAWLGAPRTYGIATRFRF